MLNMGYSIETLIDAERRRQWAKLILIPSESICLPEAAAVLASPFSNVYAEGQPAPPLMHDPRDAASDASRFESWQTRLGDGRYYRGCVNANRVELLAQRFIAEAYSKLEGSPEPGAIHVCVQALSGAPANIAVYEALLDRPVDDPQRRRPGSVVAQTVERVKASARANWKGRSARAK